MSQPMKTTTKETAEIARRVLERRNKAPNVTVSMVNGEAQLKVGEGNKSDDLSRLV